MLQRPAGVVCSFESIEIFFLGTGIRSEADVAPQVLESSIAYFLIWEMGFSSQD